MFLNSFVTYVLDMYNRLAAGTLVAVGGAGNRARGLTVGPLLTGLAFRF